MVKNVVFVEFSASMSRVPLNIEGFEQFFFKGWSNADKNMFYQQHVGKLTLYLISKKTESDFRNIVMNVRSQFDKYAVAHSKGSKTRYLPEKSLDSFIEVYKDYREQYFDLLEEICSKYEKIRERFLKDALMFPPTDKERVALYKKLNADILPVKNFREAFKLDVTIISDIDTAKNKVISNRCLGKAIGIADKLVDDWTNSFRNSKNETIHINSLNRLEEKIESMLNYDIKEDLEFKSIIQDFVAIKNANGMGRTTKQNLPSIKKALRELAIKYDVMDMLNS